MKDDLWLDLVSIIVPVYNVEPYLVRCVNSLLKQTYSNIEIILVDDGSTDSSGVMCDAVKADDDRVKVVHKQNQGLGEARNTGVSIAKGEWVCFVDSDDFVDPRYVELLLRAVKTNGTKIAQCKYERGEQESFHSNSNTIEIQKLYLDDFYRYCFVTEGHSIYSCWNYIYHNSIFRDIRFMDIRHTEDVPFIQEVLWYCAPSGLSTVNQTLYYWFQRPGSIMNRKAELNLLNQIKAYEIVMKFWKDKHKDILYGFFFDTYFTCLIDDYLKLIRDIPDQKDSYKFLVDKIHQNYHLASLRAHGKLMFDRNGFDLIQYLSRRRVIVYGYGENGKKLLPWLFHYNISIEEVWDRKADIDKVSGIKYRSMHSVDTRELTVLLTVQNEYLSIQIKQELENIGIVDVFNWKAIDNLLKKRNYKDYIPFLYEVGDETNCIMGYACV